MNRCIIIIPGILDDSGCADVPVLARSKRAMRMYICIIIAKTAIVVHM